MRPLRRLLTLSLLLFPTHTVKAGITDSDGLVDKASGMTPSALMRSADAAVTATGPSLNEEATGRRWIRFMG
jgi:hypothetical protein